VELLAVMHPQTCDLACTSCNGDAWASLIDDFAFRIEEVVGGVEFSFDRAYLGHCADSCWKGFRIGRAQAWDRELIALTGLNYRQWAAL
jgi:hypothetical protein